MSQSATANVIRDIVYQAEQNIMKSNQKNGEQHEKPQDPGPSPLFLFMPKKIQILKMLIKAAYHFQLTGNHEEEEEEE